jgi:predicted enzyme related to lactoylglutathione lyase
MSIEVNGVVFVSYYVADIERARRFYEEILGLKMALEYEGAPGKWWIEYDVGVTTFAVRNFGEIDSKIVPALEVADIEAAFAAVEAAKATITEKLEEFPRCRSFTIKDPDGNEIMIHQLRSSDEVPKFDSKAAKKITPYLHQPTGRTVGHHQAAADGQTHLFSPTGFFVATKESPNER